MFVKICGLTNLEDSLAAADFGAQALGFNFVESSPRYIGEDALAEWIERIPANIWRVGVFADEPAAQVSAMCRRLGLHVAQLHGSESIDDLPTDVRVWKAVRVRAGFDTVQWQRYPTEALLLDGPASGTPFDWSVAGHSGRKVVLAGGLHPGNVREAIGRVQPWGVDVCSRIEISPRKKDHQLMAKFLEKALSC